MATDVEARAIKRLEAEAARRALKHLDPVSEMFLARSGTSAEPSRA